MKTSYFARWKEVTCPVAISSSVPEFYLGPRFIELAPPRDLVMTVKAGRITHEAYAELYRLEVLERLDPREVWNALVSRHSAFATLLCYEQAPQFCHRRLVASWFEKNLGARVPEYAAD